MYNFFCKMNLYLLTSNKVAYSNAKHLNLSNKVFFLCISCCFSSCCCCCFYRWYCCKSFFAAQRQECCLNQIFVVDVIVVDFDVVVEVVVDVGLWGAS